MYLEFHGRAAGRRAIDREHHRAAARRARRIGQRHLAADHHGDEPLFGCFRGRNGADHLAILQHGDAVGQRQHFGDAVRDEHDGRAARAQRSQQREQALGLDDRQRRSRLVKDQHPRLARQRAGDLQQLAFGTGKVGDRPAQVERGPEGGEHCRTVAQHPCAIDQRSAARLTPQEQVRGRVEVRHQPRVLVDHRNAARDRLAGRDDRCRHAIDADAPGVGRVDAGQHAHQRGLAGAVFADQRVDLTGADVERDVVQRTHAGKGLLDVLDGEQRRRLQTAAPPTQAREGRGAFVAASPSGNR